MGTTQVAERKSLEPFVRDDAVFYQHQIDGIRRMARMSSAVLADEMGLGKSIQALTVFAIDVKKGYSTKAIVVCPASLKPNWAAEIEKFTRFNYVVLPGGGVTPVARQLMLEKFKEMEGPKILVVNYEQVRMFLDQLNREFFDFGIFDEAHYLKSPFSARTRNCRALYTRRSLMLTGSPMPNNVTELWVMLDRCNPGKWGTYYKFRNQFALYGSGKNQGTIVGVNRKDKLRQKLSNVMVRRLKKDCLDLPEVQIIERVVGLTVEQHKMYERVYNDMIVEYANGLEDNTKIKNAAVRFMRLLQVCGTTFTLDEEMDQSQKLDQAVDDAVQLILNGDHIVVFTRWRKVQEAFVKRLEKAMPRQFTEAGEDAPIVPVRVLNGDIPAEDVYSKRTGKILHKSRESIKQDWENDAPGALACMYQVAGLGMNMTKASKCLRLDKLFVPDLNKQAIDRLHRIGADRTKPIQVFDYIVAHTAEQRVNQILKMKTKMNAEVLDVRESEMAMMRAVIEADRRGDPY